MKKTIQEQGREMKERANRDSLIEGCARDFFRETKAKIAEGNRNEILLKLDFAEGQQGRHPLYTDAVRLYNEALQKQKDAEPLTVTEAWLFKIAMGCPKLDGKNRKPPSHWQAFLAAWKYGQSAYEMERRHHGWKRRTADERLRNVERTLLSGNKVSGLSYDPAILRNVEAQLKSAHDYHATMHRPDLLDNTTGADNEEN